MNRGILKWMIYALPIPVLGFSLCVGPSDVVSPRQVLIWFLSFFYENSRDSLSGDALVSVIIGDVRLPRIVLTFLVGSALSISGSAMQALFRNPLVSPYVLGVSSGSAFGAALAIIVPILPIQFSAFAFGIMAAGISYFIARIHNTVSVTSLVLSGVIISSVFTSFLALIQFIIDPNRLQAIVHWTMGNLHTATWSKIYSGGPLILVSAMCLLLLGWRMNVLAMGDDEAKAVGINPEREKLFILLPAVLATSASVAVAGIIGFMGLVVPHLVRMMLGPDNRRAIPACFCFGGVFLVLMDNIARSIALVEIPVGIFSNFLGAPLFVYLLRKSRTGWDI
jgi:iron complex transport system permease protein